MYEQLPWESVCWTALTVIWIKLYDNIYNKITSDWQKILSEVGEEIRMEYGIPIVNKRISITPIALIGGSACKSPEDFVTDRQNS